MSLTLSQEKDQGSKPPAATVQAVAAVHQVPSSPPDEDAFWIFAVSAPRILVDSGADEHVCPKSFASAPPLGLVKGGTLHDAQGHVIEAHGTRTVYMRLGPEGQIVGARFRVTNVKTPVLSTGKLVKQGYRFEAGPTGCNMSKGDRSVTLDVVKNSLWLDATAYTTAEGARNADARLVAPVVVKNCCHAQARPHHASRQLVHLVGPQLGTWTVLHQLRTCENGCASYEN